jgi:hypothetical protein
MDDYFKSFKSPICGLDAQHFSFVVAGSWFARCISKLILMAEEEHSNSAFH